MTPDQVEAFMRSVDGGWPKDARCWEPDEGAHWRRALARQDYDLACHVRDLLLGAGLDHRPSPAAWNAAYRAEARPDAVAETRAWLDNDRISDDEFERGKHALHEIVEAQRARTAGRKRVRV